MKTIIEYLETLDEPYKTQAINNTDKDYLQDNKNSITEALKVAFLWSESPEGHHYWDDLHSLLCISNTFKD